MSEDRSAEFLRKWLALASSLGLDMALSKKVGDYLLAQYTGTGRHYHDVRHIVSMLDGFDALSGKFHQPAAAELAIFFHDAVYDPSRSDNEERSAQTLHEKLHGLADDALLGTAQFTIEATKHHALTPNSDTNLVLDLDMAILGQPWPIYERYAQDVMQEYLPVYGEAAYRQGRVKLFLEPTIAQGTIFLTDDFKPLNEAAIRNMRREVEILGSG